MLRNALVMLCVGLEYYTIIIEQINIVQVVSLASDLACDGIMQGKGKYLWGPWLLNVCRERCE